MIDKSIRADYAIQGGGPNYLGKQKMVKAPKKWQSSPDHDPAELAYITKKEKDILIALDVHGSLKDGKPNRGPSGIISLQGDLGGYGGSGGSSSSGSSGGDGNRDRFRTQPPPTPTVTRSRIQEETQKQFEADQAARVREILTRGRGTDIPGERLFEDRISKGAVNEIDPETGKYNAEAIQKAAKTQARERALGIGTPLTTEEITSLPLGTRIEDLVPTPEKTDTRTLTQKLMQPTITKKNVTDFAKKQAINFAAQKAGLSGVLSFANPLMALYGFFGGGKKDPLRGIRKQVSKFKKPDIDTQKESTKKLVKGPSKDNRDENNIVQQVAGDKDVISEGIKKFTLTEDQRKEATKRRSIVQNILKQGSYQGNELTNQQRDQLTNYIAQIDQYLVPVEMAAYGGRIDKPLKGRSRDI